MALLDWFKQFFRPDEPFSLRDCGGIGFYVPEGLTEDMHAKLRAGCIVEDLVSYILAAKEEGRPYNVLIVELMEKFGLSEDDADLSLDRVDPGVFRADLGAHHCPKRYDDPIAWETFQRAIAKR